MDRKSPIPLWAVVSIGIILVGGVYLLAQRSVAPPETSLNVRQISVLPTGAPTSAPPTPVSSPTSSPMGTAKRVPSNWKTYRNTRFGFDLKYPPSWNVSAPSEGAARPAGPNDSEITVTPAIGELGLSISASELGSDAIGDAYRSAQNLDQYLALVTSDVPTSVLEFSYLQSVDSHAAQRYTTCWGAGDFHECAPRIYLQDGKNVYEMNDDDPNGALPVGLFDEIVSLFHFGA
jgi:hypothetical protein